MLQLYLTLADENEKNKFEQLYLRHRGLMLSCAYNILRDSALAEDAVHSAFLKVLGNMSKIGEIDSPHTRSFLFVITENVAKTMYSKRARLKTLPIEEAYAKPSAESAEDKFNAEYVAGLIAALPEKYSRVLMLRYLNQLTDREIASVLSVSESAVRKRLQRAREMLRKSLEE